MTRRWRPASWWRVALLLVAVAAYLGILLVRGGPPATGDTPPLTAVTTAVSHGDLHDAATVAALPDPPGYALLMAPIVTVLRPVVGSPTWCTTAARAAALRPGAAVAARPDFANVIDECGHRAALPSGRLGSALPPWYRAQGLLGLLAWVALVIGAWMLLRAAGPPSPLAEVALVAFLVVLPAASSAVVQLFHPQDLLSLALCAAGLAQTLRRRFVVAGALFGVAFLTKQFAVLVLVPAVAAAPDGRARLRLVLPALTVTVVGLLPFFVVAPRPTLENVSGIGAGGAVEGSTLLSLARLSPTVVSAVARDFPVAVALVSALWAQRRLRHRLLAPEPLLGLVLACLASRLVFESVVFPYYLLGASVVFFLLDLSAARVPDRSLAWIAVTATFVAFRPTEDVVEALGTLVLAVVAVACGLAQTARSAPEPSGVDGADVVPPDGVDAGVPMHNG